MSQSKVCLQYHLKCKQPSNDVIRRLSDVYKVRYVSSQIFVANTGNSLFEKLTSSKSAAIVCASSWILAELRVLKQMDRVQSYRYREYSMRK